MATAGMLSAAILLAPGCTEDMRAEKADDPVRGAAFRSLAARDHLLSCPGSAGRRETRFHQSRLEELKQLAARKPAGAALWLGENDWAGVARYSDRPPCAVGEAAYAEALSAFSAALDRLARAIADHRE